MNTCWELEMDLDLLEREKLHAEALGMQNHVEPKTPVEPAVEESATSLDDDSNGHKTDEKLEQMMQSVKDFIRQIDVSSL